MFLFISVLFLALSYVPQRSFQQSFPYTNGYRSSFSTYQNGNINLLISAPHGGSITPNDLPDRTIGGCLRTTGPNAGVCTWWHNDTCTDGVVCNTTTVKDFKTDEFADNVAKSLNATWGYRPNIIIAAWHRIKVDYNREVNEATLNYPEAITSYQAYHSFINQTITQMNNTFGSGLLIDIHGHGQGNYTMIGYLLSGSRLNQDNLTTLSVTTSIEPLCGTNREECIRGSNSFGTALENNGLGIAYPSSANPKPGSIDFLSGGYITQNYISRINAIQTELPNSMRTASNRADNAKRYAQALIDFMQAYNLLRTTT